jgi:hypothetical protein
MAALMATRETCGDLRRIGVIAGNLRPLRVVQYPSGAVRLRHSLCGGAQIRHEDRARDRAAAATQPAVQERRDLPLLSTGRLGAVQCSFCRWHSVCISRHRSHA